MHVLSAAALGLLSRWVKFLESAALGTRKCLPEDVSQQCHNSPDLALCLESVINTPGASCASEGNTAGNSAGNTKNVQENLGSASCVYAFQLLNLLSSSQSLQRGVFFSSSSKKCPSCSNKIPSAPFSRITIQCFTPSMDFSLFDETNTSQGGKGEESAGHAGFRL